MSGLNMDINREVMEEYMPGIVMNRNLSKTRALTRDLSSKFH
jgi:hypothetical protein